jgi:hypothetical protein
LVAKVFKDMGAITKPPEDLTGYFDLAMRKRVKQELKKEQAGLESVQAINLWKETFRYDYVAKLAEANVRSYYRENRIFFSKYNLTVAKKESGSLLGPSPVPRASSLKSGDEPNPCNFHVGGETVCLFA